MIMRQEYLVRDLVFSPQDPSERLAEYFQDQLNEIGQDGWELKQVISLAHTYWRCVFSRAAPRKNSRAARFLVSDVADSRAMISTAISTMAPIPPCELGGEPINGDTRHGEKVASLSDGGL